MIDPSIVYICIILTIFVVIILALIFTGNFWRAKPTTHCAYCQSTLTDCKIYVTNGMGVRIYCSPECLEEGLKIDSEEME